MGCQQHCGEERIYPMFVQGICMKLNQLKVEHTFGNYDNGLAEQFEKKS